MFEKFNTISKSRLFLGAVTDKDFLIVSFLENAIGCLFLISFFSFQHICTTHVPSVLSGDVFQFFCFQESYSWRGSILILSAFMGNACVCAAVMFPEPKPPSKCTDNPVGFCDHNQNTKISSLRHVNTRLHNQFESRFEEDNLSDARTEANAITKMDGRDSQRRNSFAVIRNFVLHPWIRRKSSVADDDVCEECKLDQIDFKLEEFEKLEVHLHADL